MTCTTARIIGGGVAGAATALALHKAGLEATIHEARPGPEDGGVFLTLASNGIDALRTLRADAHVLAAGFPTPAITLRSGTGKRLGAVRTGGTLPDGTVSHTLMRADLHRTLLDQVHARGIPVEYGTKLTTLDRGDADVLIGADGVHSTVRRLLDPKARGAVHAGLLNVGGVARGVTVDATPGTYEMIFGRRAFFGYVVPADATHEVWWFANVPVRDAERDLATLFAGDAGPAAELIAATADPSPAFAVHTVPNVRRWHDGRATVLVGDAAHAPSPSSGQGASLAIEDAVVLAQCLRDAPDAAAALARYERTRRERVERIVKWAARVNSSKAAGPVGRRIRDAVMPLVLRMTADSAAARRVHDHHIVWEERPRARV
jgi:2-polyprenyl-6-methoxyphenol hydroxylase-like FAD-dependent oxidoreductase